MHVCALSHPLQRLKRSLKNSDVSREEIEYLKSKLMAVTPDQVGVLDAPGLLVNAPRLRTFHSPCICAHFN
eukprot:1136174-Pelagomonas_calceolata.AAC.2